MKSFLVFLPTRQFRKPEDGLNPPSTPVDLSSHKRLIKWRLSAKRTWTWAIPFRPVVTLTEPLAKRWVMKHEQNLRPIHLPRPKIFFKDSFFIVRLYNRKHRKYLVSLRDLIHLFFTNLMCKHRYKGFCPFVRT